MFGFEEAYWEIDPIGVLSSSNGSEPRDLDFGLRTEDLSSSRGRSMKTVGREWKTELAVVIRNGPLTY